MDVILVKQQGRNGDAQRKPLLEKRWYAWELEQVAAQEKVQIVDLFKLWQDHCISIGADRTTQLYMNGDTLHPNRQGAEKLAELFATQFKQKPDAAVQPTEPPAAEPPATEPTAPTLPEPETQDEFHYGDVNFDGEVDVFDLALVKRQLTNGIFGRNALRRGDVDADGNITGLF